MIPALSIISVPLTRQKGVFKPCMWCGGTIGRVEKAPVIEPANHAGRMICTGCGRQTGWLSAKAVRRAHRLITPN